MKKVYLTRLLLLSVILAGTLLAGCTIPGTSGNTSGTQTKAAEKIIVFQSKVEITDQMEALAKEYQAETGVEVEVWGTTGDDYFQQLKTKLANNQGPVVFSLAPGSESAQMAAYLEDLSDLAFVDKIADGMANIIDDKIVGIPYTVEGFGLVYNKSMVNPEDVKDYDSFLKMMQEQKANGINGLSLSQESYFLIGHILNTPFAIQENPDQFVADLAAGKVKIADTPEFQEFAKFYAAIRDNAQNPLEINYDKEIGDLATGKSASIHQGNWCAAMFNDYEMDFELGMMPLPLRGNDRLAVSVPAAWYINSQATEAEKQAGKDFLNWLYTSEPGKKYLMDEFGFIPVVAGMESQKLDVLSQEVARFTESGKTIPWPMSQWPAGIVDVYLVPIAEQFFTTDMTVEELLSELDKAWAEASK